MAAEFWNLSILCPHHPLNRLVGSVVEIFTCSYSNIGAHAVLYDAAILEFKILIQRIYEVFRKLFPKLPSSRQMYSKIPSTNLLKPKVTSIISTNNNLIKNQFFSKLLSSTLNDNNDICDAKNIVNLEKSYDLNPSVSHSSFSYISSDSSSLKKQNDFNLKNNIEFFDNFSLDANDLNNLLINDSKINSNLKQTILNTSFSLFSAEELIQRPCCDFILDYLFLQCYADLFTIYSIRCVEFDRKYWEHICNLNSYTDDHLLKYLDVDSLWMMDSDNTNTLNAFHKQHSLTQKNIYEPAINTFQRLSSQLNPNNKLILLAETFAEISACVNQLTPHRRHVWSGDELLPVIIYVVIRAQIQHLGAEIRLITDFCPQLTGAGQIELMFTNLKAAYVQICIEK